MNYQSQINDLQMQINRLRNHIEQMKTEPQATEVKSKKFKPKLSEEYGYITSNGVWYNDTWSNYIEDNYRHATGNCYPYTDEGKEQAIWEQVTRKKYETALWDAADWVEGESYHICYFNKSFNKLVTTCYYKMVEIDKPRFATEQSAIDAHTRILGNDAERYFNRR